MCDAMHLAEELSGRFRKDRKALAAIALSDPAFLTCAANDFGYEKVFSRAVDSLGQKGDILFAISTSGNSSNIINAAKLARQKGLSVIALTGASSCALAQYADVHLFIPGQHKYSDRIQEMHIKCIHILVELVERELFPENYQS